MIALPQFIFKGGIELCVCRVVILTPFAPPHAFRAQIWPPNPVSRKIAIFTHFFWVKTTSEWYYWIFLESWPKKSITFVFLDRPKNSGQQLRGVALVSM